MLAIMASDIPVFPVVASTIKEFLLRTFLFSQFSIILITILSLMLPLGLRNSNFAKMLFLARFEIFCNFTRGVLPIKLSKLKEVLAEAKATAHLLHLK
jgi:hypothetical protein